MSLAMTVLLRVARRRLAAGETAEAILRSYPRLTADEGALLRAALTAAKG